MKIVSECNVAVISKQLVDLAFRVFRFSQFVGDIDLPVRELVIQRSNPFRDACFTRVNLLTATYIVLVLRLPALFFTFAGRRVLELSSNSLDLMRYDSDSAAKVL